MHHSCRDPGNICKIIQTNCIKEKFFWELLEHKKIELISVAYLSMESTGSPEPSNPQ